MRSAPPISNFKIEPLNPKGTETLAASLCAVIRGLPPDVFIEQFWSVPTFTRRGALVVEVPMLTLPDASMRMRSAALVPNAIALPLWK